MSDDRPSFEDLARALAEELNRAVERLSEIDVEEIARNASAEADRLGHWVEDLARSLRDAPSGPPERRETREDPLRGAAPHPLDLPSAEQGLALAALDSGRWRLEPGTSTLVVSGDGPGPSDALGLVRELRVRDWMTADGELTLTGRKALERWLQAS